MNSQTNHLIDRALKMALVGLAFTSLVSCDGIRNKISSTLSNVVESSSDDSSLIPTISATEVETRLRYTKGRMIVIFWSESDKDSAWLEECAHHMIKPYGEEVDFVKIDMDKEDDAIERLKERAPSVIRFYEDGYCVGRLTELQSSDQLGRFVKKWIERDNEDSDSSESTRTRRKSSKAKSKASQSPETAPEKPAPSPAASQPKSIKKSKPRPAKTKTVPQRREIIDLTAGSDAPAPLDLNEDDNPINPLPPGVYPLKRGEINDERSPFRYR